ncbi:hypothetical protein [Geochorda subterranea]|uniref:Uncharacterized protein n=1 Tax=Geochorda subterranea TaxID=3109564 RepID=A0ABZ1BPH6_9FIRM|nr:hypothetical protein [Limnochorda sp. LNt]WRP14594.1 hypothetical protein VLY81_00025 [Limnochorda sp. LNt]
MASVAGTILGLLLIFGAIDVSTIDRWLFPADYWRERVKALEASIEANNRDIVAATLELEQLRRTSDLLLARNLQFASSVERDPAKAPKLALDLTAAQWRVSTMVLSDRLQKANRLRSELEHARAEAQKFSSSGDRASPPYRALLRKAIPWVLASPFLIAALWLVVYLAYELLQPHSEYWLISLVCWWRKRCSGSHRRIPVGSQPGGSTMECR